MSVPSLLGGIFPVGLGSNSGVGVNSGVVVGAGVVVVGSQSAGVQEIFNLPSAVGNPLQF